MNYIKKADSPVPEGATTLWSLPHWLHHLAKQAGVQYQLPSPEKLGQQVNCDNFSMTVK